MNKIGFYIFGILSIDLQWFLCRNLRYLKIGIIASIISLILVNVFSKITPVILDLYLSSDARYTETAPPKDLPYKKRSSLGLCF